MRRNSKNLGFTLVELLIGMAILVSLMIMVVGIINPGAMLGKGRDSRRKSDLNKIKIAFEEYFNDKGYYPTSTELTSWNVSSNCGNAIPAISKYLKSWPCDPSKKVYTMISMDNWFKVVTNLENKKDDDIPSGWYDSGTYSTSGFDKNSVNYGVSSTNILWYGEDEGNCIKSTCSLANCNDPVGSFCPSESGQVCYMKQRNGSCNDPNCIVDSCVK